MSFHIEKLCVLCVTSLRSLREKISKRITFSLSRRGRRVKTRREHRGKVRFAVFVKPFVVSA